MNGLAAPATQAIPSAPSNMVTPTTSSASSSISDSSGQAGEADYPAVNGSIGNAQHMPISTNGVSDVGQPTNDSAPHHPIAEFLYQLTKMLSDDNNEIIEWSQGRIKVHYPERLEGEVLHKYFRHSKFASFQRQLNYFGFRKIAGKGKMSPCSYVNDAATSDIRSLLLIKRKTNGSAARKAAMNRVMAPGGMPDNGAIPHMSLNLSAEFFNKAMAVGFPQSAQGLQVGPNMQNQQMMFAENALRFGISQHQLQQHLQQHHHQQQQQQQRPFGESLFFPSDNTLAALANGQKRHSFGDVARFNMNAGFGPTLEQLQSQLSGLVGNMAGGMSQPGLSMGTAMQANASMNNMGAPGSATGAMNAANSMPVSVNPATAALNAANAAGKNNNMFESTPHLNSLVNEQPGATNKRPSAMTAAGLQCRVASQSLLNRLPSSGTLFPDTLSSASLTHLMPGLSSNRLSSMISLNSFLSRDPSLADLLMLPGNNVPYPGQVGAPGVGFEPTPLQDVKNPRFASSGNM